VVEFSKTLKMKEEALNKRIRELDQKLTSVDADKMAMRQEIDASLRREWEVKARLEIDRLVATEIENLQRKFESEVQVRVEAELAQRKTVAFGEVQELSSSASKSDYPHSSIGCASADGEFPSTTDITELSVDSPEPPAQASKKAARTPFGRAQTMFVTLPAGTPMDVEMASPSPIAIASLSLSPRRAAATKAPAPSTNIFAANQAEAWSAVREIANSDSDPETEMPSPSRIVSSRKNPFTSKQRPMLQAQKTAPLPRLQSKQTLFPPNSGASEPQSIRRVGSNGALRERSDSPNRRLSKIPSAANLNALCNKSSGGSGSGSGSDSSAAPSLNRKTSFTSKKDSTEPTQPPVLSKMTGGAKIRGRTLVELQQARAGGRPLSAVLDNPNVSPSRPFRDHLQAANRGALDPAPVWDPERDEMPSPFLVRRKPGLRA